MRNSLSPNYRRCVERLYDDYKNIMFSTAMGIVKDKAQAEDIVQFAFIRIIKHIEKLSNLPDGEVRGYIVLIIKHLSFDNLRKRKQEKVVSIESVDCSREGDTTEEAAIAKVELGRVKESLRSMDDKYSLPLILKYSLGFSHSEIADMLGISVENVKVRCHRGKRILMDAVRKGVGE
jgi:RNA polymerase sigma-70 factor (ECF subfamily)